MYFFIIAAALIVPVIGIPIILRNLLGADKKKWNSYNHINNFRKKGDLMLRALFIILLLASMPWSINNPLVISGLMTGFIIVQLSFRTFAEWKFCSNRQNYKVSLVEIALLFVTILGVILLFS
ncbi:DUF4181 domain-containing protein [Halobacillus alkaliphilus]